MAVEKVIVKNKPNVDDYGQYNYTDGDFGGVNSLDASSDLYSRVFENNTNENIIDNVYLPSYGIQMSFDIIIYNAIDDISGADLNLGCNRLGLYFVDDKVGNMLNYIKEGVSSNIIENPYVNGNGQNSTDYTGITNIYNSCNTSQGDCQIYYHEKDDTDGIELNEHDAGEKEMYRFNHWDDPFLENFLVNPTFIDVEDDGNLDEAFANNNFDTNQYNWLESLYGDVEGNFYFIAYLDGKEDEYGGDMCSGSNTDRAKSITVFKIPKSFLLDLITGDQTEIRIGFGKEDWGKDAGGVHDDLDYTFDMPDFISDENPGSSNNWPSMGVGYFFVKITKNGEWNFDIMSAEEQNLYSYTNDYELPLYTSESEWFYLNPSRIIDYRNLRNNNTLLDSSDIIDFRPISTIITTTEIADEDDVIDFDFYDIQNYYEDLNDTEKDKISAPNTVKLSLKMADYADNFEINYLTPSDVGDFGFIGFVTNWDWEEGDPETLDEISDTFPNNTVDMGVKQNMDDTYYYIQSAVPNVDDNFVIESDYLQHTYQTAGIKIIQAVVFSYLENPDDNTQIQAIRWKLIKIRIYLDMDSVYIQDFSDIGGFDFTHIPWPYTTGMVGGLSEKSKYRKSLTQIVRTDNFGEHEYLDKSLTKLAYKNEELGDYFGSADVSQLRLFASGSYDLNTLLNISELAYIDNAGDGTPDDYNPPSDSEYWDGIINQFPQESSIGSIFIDDEQDIDFKESCVLELNCGDIDGDVIRDSSGNGNKGILIGDYELKKDSKETPLSRDSGIKVPNTGTDDLAF